MFGWRPILQILSQVSSLHTLEVKLPSVENEKPIRVGEGGSLSRTDPCEMHFFCRSRRLFASAVLIVLLTQPTGPTRNSRMKGDSVIQVQLHLHLL